MSAEEVLLERALHGLESLRSLGGPPPWTLGGGVALALTWHHRQTLDVDIFMNDAQWLTALSPRLNDRVGRSSTDYEEGSANLRVIYPEGAVDFVIAPTLTATLPRHLDLGGRLVRVDDAGEILAKKVHYRPASFLVRDVVDLAFALEYDPGPLAHVAPFALLKRESLRRRLAALASGFEASASLLALSPDTERLLPRAVAALLAWLDTL